MINENIVLYGYLYEREKKWGFKVDNRELSFYNLTPEKLNKKNSTIIKANGSYNLETEIVFVLSNGKLYGNFIMDPKFSKAELVRIEIPK